MKILLVYPQYPNTFWSFKYALNFILKKASNPPLGLLTIASLLPIEWELKLKDLNTTKLYDKDLAWADMVFISAMSVQKKSVDEVIARCKATNKKIVAGGPLFTSNYLEYAGVDYFVLNEAELTLPQFLHDLGKGNPQHIYTSNQWADLSTTPKPRWGLIKMRKYASMSIQFSRGCPFNCEFCDITHLYGNRTRIKSEQQVIDELDHIYSEKWRGPVFFVDDNFIGNKNILKTSILPAIIQWMEKKRYPFTFFTQASINLADDEELIQMMVEAGFNTVFIGIESPHQDSLTECTKVQNKNRDLVSCIEKIQKSGLQVQGGFIVGFDNDPATIFELQAEFIRKSKIITAMVGILNAPLGTKLYERLKTENRLTDKFSGDNTDCSTNFVPKINYDTLVEGYKSMLTKIYAPKNYYKRVGEFLKIYNNKQKKAFRLKWVELLAFARSTVQLGFFSKERFQYCKLILWTLFTRPSKFPMAVTFAIYGYHFRKFFEQYS